MFVKYDQKKQIKKIGVSIGIYFLLVMMAEYVGAAERGWSDYKKPLRDIRVFQHGKFAIEGAEVTVYLPKKFLDKHREIVLRIRIESQTDGGFEGFLSFIRVNKAIFKTYSIPTKDLPYTQTHQVAIETKDLNVGNNTLHFTFRWNDSNTYCSAEGCGYIVKEVSFKDAAMPTPTPRPTPTRTPTPKSRRTPKRKSTPTSSPIQGLLKQADEYFEKKWFLTPEETNAFDTYKRVLRLESNNRHAREKLREIMRQYTIWGENNAIEGNYEKARSYYERGLTVGSFLMEELRDESVANAYQELQQQVEFVTNPPTPTPAVTPTPHSTPTPSTYMLSIYSTPSGAKVYLGNTYKGTTPLKISDVVGGYWTLKLEKSGYRSYKTTLVLSSLMPHRLSYSYTLNPAPTPTPTQTATPHPTPTPSPSAYTLSIYSKPSGAKVYLGKTYKGITPLKVSGVVGGSWSLRLKKLGYQSYETKFFLSPSMPRNISYSYTLIPLLTPTPTPIPTPVPIPTRTPTPIPDDTSGTIPEDVHAMMQRPGQIYGVIVGIGDYDDVWIPDFRFTERDAQTLYDTLIDPRYGAIPAENIKLLLGKDATQRAVRQALGTWLPRQVEEEDVVLVYYAGHGAIEDRGGYWVTYDAHSDDLYSTALSHRKIQEMFTALSVRHTVVLLDASYEILTFSQEDIEWLEQVEVPWHDLHQKHSLILSASDGKRLSLELKEEEHGAFTYALLQGLREGADENEDGLIMFNEIAHYVQRSVTQLAAQRDSDQSPQRLGESVTEFPIGFHVDNLRQQSERLRRKEHAAYLQELYQAGNISEDQYQRAVNVIETGVQDQILEDFLSGNLPLELFQDIF